MRDEVKHECDKWAEYRKPFVEIEAQQALEKAKKREARAKEREEQEERESNEAAVRSYQEQEEQDTRDALVKGRLPVDEGKKVGSKARKVDKGKGKEIEEVFISDEDSSPAKEVPEQQAADVNSSQPFAFPFNDPSSKASDRAGKPKPPLPSSSTSPTLTSRKLPVRGAEPSPFVPHRLPNKPSPELGHSDHVDNAGPPDVPSHKHVAVSPPPPSRQPPIPAQPRPEDDSSEHRSPSASPKWKKRALEVGIPTKRDASPPRSPLVGTHTRFTDDDAVAREEGNARSASVVVEPLAVDSIFDGPANSQAGRGEKYGEDEDDVVIVEPASASTAARPPAPASRLPKARKATTSPELGVEADSSIEVVRKPVQEKKGKGKEEGRDWGQKGGNAGQAPETITIDD